jgi:hypothetical protein
MLDELNMMNPQHLYYYLSYYYLQQLHNCSQLCFFISRLEKVGVEVLLSELQDKKYSLII